MKKFTKVKSRLGLGQESRKGTGKARIQIDFKPVGEIPESGGLFDILHSQQGVIDLENKLKSFE